MRIKSIHEIPSPQIFLSTWQSIFNQKKAYFEQFGTIFVDECHQYKADALKGILEKSTGCKFRYGFTGTLEDSECHRMTIEGLLGKSFEVTDTATLMRRGIVSQLQINSLILKYDDETRKAAKAFKYQDEQKFIVQCSKRNTFIKNLACSFPKDENTLILTAYREHIELLKKRFEDSGREVYVVHGEIDVDIREEIRKIAESKTGIIILATYGVYSTGVNIKNLQNLIFATGSKSLIRVLQSIGRLLRRDGKANKASIWDIVDDFSTINKNGDVIKKNYLLVHFFERLKIYAKQKFKHKSKTINIKV